MTRQEAICAVNEGGGLVEQTVTAPVLEALCAPLTVADALTVPAVAKALRCLLEIYDDVAAWHAGMRSSDDWIVISHHVSAVRAAVKASKPWG